ncbi:MAG: carboxypeptidase-like regulatory domain-containing protein [bacterium]
MKVLVVKKHCHRMVGFAALMFAMPALAQTSPSGGSVRGVIYDSVAHAPLAGAVVQAAMVDSALRAFTAVADAEGRYRIDGLPAGRFGIGFQHNALSALGLEAPLRAFQLVGGGSLVIDLAIPPGPQVRALKCAGLSVDDRDGMLAGFVLDAAQGNTLPKATVSLRWTEIGVVEGTFRTVPRVTVATVGEEGTYLACGLASETPLGITIARAGYRDVEGEITVPDGGVARRDFRLADTAAVRGTGAVTGRVAHADGAPVASGRVSLSALGLDVPVEQGAFSIGGVPAGTWLIEARVIGFEPRDVFVDVAEGAPVPLSITLSQKVQLLDAVTVFGKPGGDIKTLSGIAERRRTSFGTVFLPDNEWLKSASYPTDVLRAARGFTYLSIDSVRARGCTGIGGTGKQIVVYVDGARFAGGLPDLLGSVLMRDVLAIETYPDVISAPALWRTNDACAVIAVWTKR